MKVHHFNAATLCPMSARLVNGLGGFFERARMVCHVLLVETPRGLLLVDTGLGTGDIQAPARLGKPWLRMVSPRLSREETALAQVRALGFSPNDVQDVVLTHLDLDHAGGIADFPAARVHVHAREHEAATKGHGSGADMRYVAAQWQHGPRWATFDDGGERWFGFEGVRAMDGIPDVLLVPLRGHTHGHTGVAVKKGDRWLLHAGDNYYFHGQVESPPHAPFVLRALQRRSDMDRVAREANEERLRKLASEHRDEVTVFCAHDPVEFDRVASGA